MTWWLWILAVALGPTFLALGYGALCWLRGTPLGCAPQ